MATQVVVQDVQQALEGAVRGWDRRWRLRETVLWLPRALVPGLLVGIILALVSRLRPWLLPGQILPLTAGAVVLGLLVMLAFIWLRPRPMLQSARRFDILFGLDERVSTALELISGRIHANAELAAAQLDDARRRAATVRPGDVLRFQWLPRDWLIVLALLVVFAALALLPNAQADAVAEQSAERAAIEDAAEEMRDITEQVATDPNLENIDRQALLQTLETSIDTLQQPDVTPEEAFASLSDAQTALQERADLFNQQLNGSAAAMDRAAEALSELSPEMEQAMDQARDSAEAMQRMMEQLAEQMESMSESQRQQAANALQQASQQMQTTNPQAAGQMQQAGQSLQQGQTGDAQQAMQDAQQSVQQGQQAQQGQQNSAEQLGQAAQQAGQAAQNVAQAGQPSQPGQQGDQGQQQGPSQQQGQQGQQGQQAGQQGQQGQSGQQSGQQGDQAGQQGQPGGNQASQQGQSGAAQQGAAQSSEAGQQGLSQAGAGAGAGDSPGGAGSEGGGEQQQPGQVSQNNNPDGEGQSEFAPVFAPRRIGGEPGDEQVILEPDGSSAPVVEGEFAENPTGENLVPYNEVYADYADSANRALESDYIPLGLRDVVRDYFTALEPGQSSGD